MLAETNSISNHINSPSTYIVSPTITTPNSPIDSTTINTNAPQILNDIKLICIQRKKKTNRHIYLTFVESHPLSSPNDRPIIEVTNKSNILTYSLNDSISFEYFDTIKNDFQTFVYVYFQSFTISIYFSDDKIDRKPLIIKHLEHMYQNKTDKSHEINNNSIQDSSQTNSQQSQTQQQASILPCSSTMEHILHTFDVNLISHGSIIQRDHVLVGPARLYFTATDLYIASINCKQIDLKVTITNQCPSKDKAILCIPYFTIKHYGNRSNIFLIELGKSNYGNGEIHMKCHSSSLASTIHLLVSPVIEERPLILSSAFQNQLLTNKRIEKSKNIQPPIQLNNDSINSSTSDPKLSLSTNKTIEPIQNDLIATTTTTSTTSTTTTTTEVKSRVVTGFFRSLAKNVSNLRRSTTFHNQQSQTGTHNNHNSLLTNITSIAFRNQENKHPNEQHSISLSKFEARPHSTSTISSVTTKKTNDTMLESTSTLSTNKQLRVMGTYVDMGPTVQKSNQNHQQQESECDQDAIYETRKTVDIGINTTISLSPHVRSAIIVENSVHLIADGKTYFPFGQRSFTSPASVMQPFKTQLTGQTSANASKTSPDYLKSSVNSSGSLNQANSVSNSHKSLLLSYGIVTFNDNDLITNDQTEQRAISPSTDGSTRDRRLNSDISLISMSQQQQGSTVDNVLSTSSSQIFHTLSVSTNNIGDAISNQIQTPHGSILFIDDPFNDHTTTTYLLGPPSIINDETFPLNSSRLTASISRPQLSNIVEEKTLSNDPYAVVEPLPSKESLQSIITTIINPFTTSEKSLDYADLLLPMHLNNENVETNDQQSDDTIDEINNFEDQERENNERPSTILYTDIDFHQTQRRDRIVKSVAEKKLEDQTPPFVL